MKGHPRYIYIYIPSFYSSDMICTCTYTCNLQYLHFQINYMTLSSQSGFLPSRAPKFISSCDRLVHPSSGFGGWCCKRCHQTNGEHGPKCSKTLAAPGAPRAGNVDPDEPIRGASGGQASAGVATAQTSCIRLHVSELFTRKQISCPRSNHIRDYDH